MLILDSTQDFQSGYCLIWSIVHIQCCLYECVHVRKIYTTLPSDATVKFQSNQNLLPYTFHCSVIVTDMYCQHSHCRYYQKPVTEILV